MQNEPQGEITELLIRSTGGNREAFDRLIPLVYDELRRLARSYARGERRDHTLQPTAIANEAYLRLVNHQRVDWQNRAHFFGIAAQVIRRILVDHARKRSAGKRGGDQARIDLDDQAVAAADGGVDVVALDEALTKLATLDGRQSRVVELRFFGGLSIEEIAVVLGVSSGTVKRDWSSAKAWLFRQLSMRP